MIKEKHETTNSLPERYSLLVAVNPVVLGSFGFWDHPNVFEEIQIVQFGIQNVEKEWIKRTIARWNYTVHKLYHIQALKFTQKNMLRYVDHIYAIVNLDPTKLKFLDECRIETRGTY